MISKKQNIFQWILLSGILCFSLPASAVSGVFAKNKAVAPLQSEHHAGERLQVRQYVPLNYSEVELRNLVNRTLREVGSRSDKQIYIVWTDKQSQKMAAILKKALLKKQLAAKQLTVAKSQYRHDIYPLYIEIHSFEAQTQACTLRAAEQRLDPESQEFCATKNNSRAQLRNPAANP
ncbi:hypothetical protein ACWA5Z_07250 [Testudinibacter sp. P80/BLE/0925]|uniref:hypothetical protein n=1 Tax=Testudinibacter sp. TW-1 TaxID=3417757 RepID=UPI003D361A38